MYDMKSSLYMLGLLVRLVLENMSQKSIANLLTVEQPCIIIDLLIIKYIFDIFIISFHLLMNSVIVMKSLGLFRFNKERIYRLVLKTVHDQMIDC